MALANISTLYLKTCPLSKTRWDPLYISLLPNQSTILGVKPLVIEAKAGKRARTRTENPKIRNRRLQKKFDGTSTKPRLSVFCSDRQLYAMLEAAELVGAGLKKAAINLNVTEISSYDRNGFACGERIKAFEIAISRHGFLPQ